jgi:hypothetical protein
MNKQVQAGRNATSHASVGVDFVPLTWYFWPDGVKNMGFFWRCAHLVVPLYLF